MYDYQDGGYVIVFKQRYPIHLVDLNYKKAVFKENEIIVYDKHIEQVLDKELKKYLLELIYKYVEFYVSKDQRLPFPKITLKKTKRRYGACFYREGRISFNPILIHSSKAFIEYVVVHELCHFIEPNHSPAFYHEIEQKLPNYKTILKEEKSMITSTSNPKIKELCKLKQKKYRDLKRCYLVEGAHLVEEAHRAGVLVEVVTSQPQLYQYENMIEVSDEVIAKLAFTNSPQPIIGICK